MRRDVLDSVIEVITAGETSIRLKGLSALDWMQVYRFGRAIGWHFTATREGVILSRDPHTGDGDAGPEGGREGGGGNGPHDA
jgi:hypothetical protein